MANVSNYYGTPEYYAEHFFQDFVADAQADSPEYGDNLVKGFLLALKDWCEYHKGQVNEYERLHERVRQALAL
jgi:hypothetical protein